MLQRPGAEMAAWLQGGGRVVARGEAGSPAAFTHLDVPRRRGAAVEQNHRENKKANLKAER